MVLGLGLFFTFTVGALVAVVNSLFMTWIAHHFMSFDKAQIAGLFFSLGGTVFGGNALVLGAVDAAAVLAGALTGLCFTGYRMIKVENMHG